MKPFLPSEIKAPPINPILRSIVRSMIAVGHAQDAEQAIKYAEKNWKDDRHTLDRLQGKAAVSPLATTTSGAPVSTALRTLQAILGKANMLGGLLRLQEQLSFGGSATLSVINWKPGAGITFNTQAGSLPVMQFSATNTLLSNDKKCGGIVAMSREVYEHSAAEIEIPRMVSASLGYSFDSLLLDANAASATRPAGLKNGISAIASDGGTGESAMIDDLANLASVVASVSATNFFYVASPRQYVKILLRKPSDFKIPILCSGALPDGQVACLGLDAFVIAGSDEAKITITKGGGAVVMDTAPGQFSVAGTPPAVAAPILSPFQSDLVMIKLLAQIDWALRDPSGFAWVQSVAW